MRRFLQLKFSSSSSSLASDNASYVCVSKMFYLSNSLKKLFIDCGLNMSEYGGFSSLPLWRLRDAICRASAAS
jgi:hypothetical protein